jgi:hypothetical protein
MLHTHARDHWQPACVAVTVVALLTGVALLVPAASEESAAMPLVGQPPAPAPTGSDTSTSPVPTPSTHTGSPRSSPQSTRAAAAASPSSRTAPRRSPPPEPSGGRSEHSPRTEASGSVVGPQTPPGTGAAASENGGEKSRRSTTRQPQPSPPTSKNNRSEGQSDEEADNSATGDGAGRGNSSKDADGKAQAAELSPSCTQGGEKVRIGNVHSADGVPGIGSVVLLDVSVRTPPASDRTYWLIADFAAPDKLYAARKEIVGTAKGLRISIATSLVPSQRTFYVVEADEQATPALRQDNAHDMKPEWDSHRTALPHGVIGIISNSCEVTRTR